MNPPVGGTVYFAQDLKAQLLGSMTLLSANLCHHCVLGRVFMPVRSSHVYLGLFGKVGGPGSTKTGAKVEVIPTSLAIRSAKLFPFPPHFLAAGVMYYGQFWGTPQSPREI